MARTGNEKDVVWGITSGLLFLAAATFFAVAVTTDGDASSICAIFGSILGVLAVVAMYFTLAAHFEFWPY